MLLLTACRVACVWQIPEGAFRGHMWADPSVEHLQELLQRVRSHPEVSDGDCFDGLSLSQWLTGLGYLLLDAAGSDRQGQAGSQRHGGQVLARDHRADRVCSHHTHPGASQGSGGGGSAHSSSTSEPRRALEALKRCYQCWRDGLRPSLLGSAMCDEATSLWSARTAPARPFPAAPPGSWSWGTFLRRWAAAFR